MLIRIFSTPQRFMGWQAGHWRNLFAYSTAQEVVDALVERKNPLVWDIAGVKRVLDPSMKSADQVLLLLHAQASWLPEGDLLRSIEYSNATVFRDKVLGPLHRERLLEYDNKQHRVHISPTGSDYVEKHILKTRSP